MADTDVLSQRNPPSSAQIYHPAVAVDDPDSLQGAQYLEDGLSSSPPLALRPQPSWNADPDSDLLIVGQPPLQALRTDGEPTPTLTEVNPESGPTAGGARIWLKGIDFPRIFPLFARFGTAVVPTVSRMVGLRFIFEIEFYRLSPPATFLPVVYLPQPRQVSSMLHYRNTLNQMRRSMGPVSRSFTT